ncbi:MAG: ABC transporter permease [Eggerthella lenta]
MMLNYTKSELYRIVHGRELYLFTGVLCAIVLLSSVLLWAMASTPDFPYATVRFSLSNLISMLPSLFLLAGLLVWVLFADDRKDGTFKNAVADGCSRRDLFVGKCLVSTGLGLASMMVILAVYGQRRAAAGGARRRGAHPAQGRGGGAAVHRRLRCAGRCGVLRAAEDERCVSGVVGHRGHRAFGAARGGNGRGAGWRAGQLVAVQLLLQRGGHQPERPGRVSVGHAGGFGEVPDRGVRRRSGVRHRGSVARKQDGAVGARREGMRQ